MLQEWLEELAEGEMRKTASHQFEEVLRTMDIPELKAFFNLNQDLEKSAERMSPEAEAEVMRRARRAGMIEQGALTGTTGGLVGAGLGAGLGALYKRRALGAALGGLGGAALGAGGGALLGRGMGGIAGGLQAGQFGEEHPVLSRLVGSQFSPSGTIAARRAMKEQEALAAAEDQKLRQLLPEEQMPKAAEAKIKQAQDAGRTLARLGFVPKVVESSFPKLAQAPDPFAPRQVMAPTVDRQQYIMEAQRGGRLGGAIAGMGAGAMLGTPVGLAVGERIGGSKGALIGGALGGVGGGILGGVGGAKGLGYLARTSAEGLSDEEMQSAQNFNLANELHAAGRISDEELELAGQQFERARMKGELVPQTQQIPAMQAAAQKTASMTQSDQAKVTAVREAMKATKGMSVPQRKQEMKQVAKVVPGGSTGKEKSASIRDLVVGLSSRGALPRHHGWEL